MNLKPQDILVALNLCRKKEGLGSYAEKARQLGMSASEVHASERRLSEARLLDADRKIIRKNAMLEFLVHGGPYVFAVSPREWTRGVPTAWAAPVLVDKVSQGNQPPPVWPDPEGSVQGVAVKPLYSSVPRAVKDDLELYDLMALVDALRIGRVREKKLAGEALKDRLMG